MKILRAIIYTVSGIFLISLLFVIVISSYTSLDRATAGNLKERLTEYEKKAEQAAQKEAARSNWRNIAQYFDTFKSGHMMKMDDFSKFRDQLRSIYTSENLKMPDKKRVHYVYKAVFRDIIQADLNFSLVGQYADIKRFIHKMDTTAYKDTMVLFRAIIMEKQKNGQISGDFAMEVYLER